MSIPVEINLQTCDAGHFEWLAILTVRKERDHKCSSGSGQVMDFVSHPIRRKVSERVL